jgi:hypothetical protein
MTDLAQRRFKLLGLGAALLLAGGGLAPAKSVFDGHWNVTIITETGTCDPAYRYPIQILDGTVTYNLQEGSGVVDIVGKVEPNGQVKVVVRKGDQHADGTGRLSQNDGSGTWAGKSAQIACAGRWEAARS